MYVLGFHVHTCIYNTVPIDIVLYTNTYTVYLELYVSGVLEAGVGWGVSSSSSSSSRSTGLTPLHLLHWRKRERENFVYSVV